jgi:hypothetical protein
MTRTIETQRKRRSAAGRAVGIILTAALAFGTFAGTAGAEEHWRGRGEYRQHRDWNGGYYRAPPVVYGTPYYAPPLVYGPGIGLNFNIR